MATNKIPPGSRQLTVNVPADLIDDVDYLAARSGCGRSEYIRRLIRFARKNGFVADSELRPNLKVAEEESKYGNPKPPSATLPRRPSTEKTG